MTERTIRGVLLLPGGGQAPIGDADVTLDDAGVVTGIHPARSSNGLVLMPAAVDLHLDNLPARRRPRATVELDLDQVLVTLDAEVAAAGIATVCVAARFEDAPGKGVVLSDAIALCEVVERLAGRLAVDWRIHARVELTDPGVDGALASVLAGSSRIALVSMMDHSPEHTRFADAEAHRQFYAEDWGVSLDQVDAVLARKVLARKREGAGG
ncbi:MAG: alpha-D-ribose 1-methylphosphonate 5-triphosphate diphosphatase, partial [Egibacteraceae bacterium]